MTREVRTADVFAAAVPEHIDPTDPEQRSSLVTELTEVAERYVLRQWLGSRSKPVTVTDMTSEWLITATADEIEQFQPAHDCVACRAGNDQAMAFLREHPGRWVALANITYTEVWRT